MTEKTRVVITMYNGVFEGVMADHEGVEVLILEEDKHADPKDLYIVDGDMLRVNHWEADHESLAVKNLYENVEQAQDSLRCDVCQGPLSDGEKCNFCDPE